jgi:polyhydroxybutyrate depolymerase
MKATEKLLLVLMVMAVASPTLAADDDIEAPNALRAPIETELTFEGRPVRLILPKNFDRGHDPIPLILHLHGSVPFPDVPDLELDNSGYRALPSKYRVMVAAPRAALTPVLGTFTWDAFFSLVGCGPVNVDDVGFLNRLLDALLATYPIDPQRVYMYGYSAGAAMAYRMACDNAERFAGIVAGAGITLGDPSPCAPAVPISVLQFHSMDDDVILFDGGNIGNLVGEPGNPACDYPGAIETATRWAARNGCVGELKFGKKPKFDLTTIVEGKETTVNKFTHCPPGIDVELWSMEGVPHPPLFFRVGPNGIKTLAEKTWKFLRQHARDDNHDDNDDDEE